MLLSKNIRNILMSKPRLTSIPNKLNVQWKCSQKIKRATGVIAINHIVFNKGGCSFALVANQKESKSIGISLGYWWYERLVENTIKNKWMEKHAKRVSGIIFLE